MNLKDNQLYKEIMQVEMHREQMELSQYVGWLTNNLGVSKKNKKGNPNVTDKL